MKPEVHFPSKQLSGNWRDVFGAAPELDRGWMNGMDWFCVILLAFCPILQNYRGLIVDARATVLIIGLPYIIAKFCFKNRINWLLILPMLCFGIYKIIDGGTSINEIGREGLMCLYLLAAASGVVDTKKFLRVIISVATVASVLILVQYICYYIFNFHLQLVPTSLFLSSSEQWKLLAQTGAVSISGTPTGFYRPSSFFLEPAHMALYCTPSVLFLLLSPGMNKHRALLAVLITAGVVASTSGLGIMICLGLWFLYLVFYCDIGADVGTIALGKLKIKGITTKDLHFRGFSYRKLKIKSFTIKGFTLRPISMIMIVLLLLLVVLMYLFVDVFRSSVNRVLFNVDGYNAIVGRTYAGAFAVKELRGWDLILGKLNPGSEADWYMSAFHATIFDYGLIGFVLSYTFYIVSAFQLKRQHFWMALMVLGLSYFSVHTHGSSYLLFFCILLLDGHFDYGTEDPLALALRIYPFGWLKKRD